MTDEEIQEKTKTRYRVERQLTVHPTKAWILLMAGDITIYTVAEFVGPQCIGDAEHIAKLLNETAVPNFIPAEHHGWRPRFASWLESQEWLGVLSQNCFRVRTLVASSGR